MDKRILAIGGGELKNGETLKIDGYIAAEAKKAAGERRACGLFVPTASHDCMPYYNTFHKIYTGLFGIKTDVALTVNREWDAEKMRKKFERADFLYVGGGDTVFMLGHWKSSGLLPLIEEAYGRGVLLAGLSAGAICWFDQMYSDSVVEGEYAIYPGLGWLQGTACPHYRERAAEFDAIVRGRRLRAWGLENGAALEFVNGKPVRSVSDGGKIRSLDGTDGKNVVKLVF